MVLSYLTILFTQAVVPILFGHFRSNFGGALKYKESAVQCHCIHSFIAHGINHAHFSRQISDADRTMWHPSNGHRGCYLAAITAAAETDYRAYRGGLHVTFDWPAYVFQGSLGSLLYNHDISPLGTNSK